MSKSAIVRMTAAAFSWALIVVPGMICMGQTPTNDASDSATDAPCYYGTPDSGSRVIVGVTGCGGCHSRRAEDSLPFDQAYRSTRIREHEATIWYFEDKHRQAYEVLQNGRSRQMARILGIVDPQTGESLIHRDVRCLACHSVVPTSDFGVEDHLLTSDVSASPQFNLGVSCEACHGPAGTNGDNKGWVAAHFTESQSTNWRRLTPEQKFEDYGFWDVRDTRTQTKICVSCHVGNVEQGKILTHEMFAAGHPPLPGFELNAFIEQLPRHWRFAEEHVPTVRDELLALRGETFDPEELVRTKALLVSSLVTFAEAMNLNADLIDADVACPTEKPTWPELANFACFACHHELERDGWRQTRPLTLTLGRPVLHEWPTALTELTATFLGQADRLDKQFSRLDQALNQQPFGRPEAIAEACRQLAELSEAWAVSLRQQHLKRETDGQTLLKLIEQQGIEQILDYDSARQLVWAYERILSDINGEHDDHLAEVSNDETRPTWNGWLAQPSLLTEREKILKSLESILLLDLRLGKQVESVVGNEQQPRSRIEMELDFTFKKISTYDPRQVQAAFEQLSQGRKQNP